jgi:DNA-binding NtrC family response regulator
MMSGSVAGRERVVIVDRDLDFGLKLADCLASSGYHAVLGRSLDAMLGDLSEMQPGAILLSSDPRDQEVGGNGADTLQAVKALCPGAPVITLIKPRQDTSAGFRSKGRGADDCSSSSDINRVEELLRAKLGIPCARVL